MEFTINPKVKILHVTSTSTGGVGRNLLLLARYMNRECFELSFALPPDSHFYYDILKEGVNIFPINLSRNPFDIDNFWGFFQLINIIRKGKFDIIHTHASIGGLFGRLIAKLNGCPCVLWTIHGWAFNYPYGTSVRRRFFKIIEGICDRFTDHYVAVSGDMKEVGVRAGIARPEKIDVIYHGIEVEDFTNEEGEAKEGLGIAESCPVIGTVGRFEPQKALDDLLKAVKLVKERHPRIQLILVGDGPLKRDLEGLATDLGIRDNVVFAGWKKEVGSYIASMDVFCLSSLWEALGIVLLEAMAAGKPIVATRVGGVPEVVEEGEGGILVPPGRPEELASGIRLLLSSPERRKRMGHYNKEKVKKEFNVEDMIRKYEAMYERIFKGE